MYDKSSENIIWIKIDKGINDYENNIFVACVYNSLTAQKTLDALSFMIEMLLIGQNNS